MFSHQNFYRRSTFIRLHLSNNISLTATAGHYVPLNRQRYVRMDAVKVGDIMADIYGQPIRVNSIDSVYDTGLFNPHTLDGTLVVNDVLVSEFTAACKPNAARAALSFPRSLYRWRISSKSFVQSVASYFFDVTQAPPPL